MALGPGRKMKNRMIFILACVVLVAMVPLSLRLFSLQIVNYEYYQEKAIDQQTRDTIISPKRGIIYDRNLKPLAESATVETVYISPLEMVKQKEDAEFIAKNLSELLGVDYNGILDKTKKTNTQYQVIKKWLEKDESDKVRKFLKDNSINSVKLTTDTKRYYPYGNFAAHVLGFVGTDNQGLAGIEAQYDSELKGIPGRVISAKDAKNSDMPFKYEKYIDPQNGLNVVLTIDEVAQHFLEKHLETALVENKLKQKAMGIVMNVNTGEILAMAIKDDYDPNSAFEITNEKAINDMQGLTDTEKATYKKNYLEGVQWRNNLISDTYEPGSVFKSITASMALEEKIVKVTDHFTCTGSLSVGGWRISCWKVAGHGDETFAQGLQNSCNSVFMQVAAKVGREIFYKYQTAFGFKEKTGIDLPGETAGIVHPVAELNDAELATSAFGQTFKVTPIEMVCAISAIANGGTLYKPYLVKELVDDSGVVKQSTSPTAKRQVISQDTSTIMRGLLESVVSEGTGKNAYVRGFRIAGKTGTSEKIDQKDASGNTDNTKRIASFGAFAPANDPQIACLIILDEPADPKQGGGAIAAPVAGRVLEDILKYLDVEPQYTEEELAQLDVLVPEVSTRSVSDAQKIIKSAGLKVKVIGNSDTVTQQIPSGNSRTPSTSTVFLYTGDEKPQSQTIVPNVVGKTPQQANEILTNAMLNVNVTGAKSVGTVIVARQSPAAGETVSPGSTISIELRSTNDTGE